MAASVTDDDASQIGLGDTDHIFFSHTLKNLFKDRPAIYKDIMKCMHLYTQGVITINEFETLVESHFEELDDEHDKERLMKILAGRCASRRQLSWACRPLSDLVQYKCERNGSYIKLPEEYPAIIATGRLDWLRPEFNNAWISVASGSEHTSFKIMRKNGYEDQLFKCEDDRFEHDMAINCCENAIAGLEIVIAELPEALKKGDSDFAYRKCAQGSLYRSLRKLLMEYISQFLEYVRIKPEITMKKFLEDIKQHHDRHVKSKHDQEKVWKEICEKNFYKSLDHRAFYFKQNEKKSTNTKAFYNDIKSRFDNRLNETTPELIKKGGTSHSVYYNSLSMLQPDEFHVKPISGDIIGNMNSTDVKKYAEKMPQYQLRFDKKDAFIEAYKIIIDQIMSAHGIQIDKDKTRLMLDKLIEDFLKFDTQSIPTEEGEALSEEEIKLIMSEGFLQKRLENSELPFSEAWEKIKSANAQETGEDKNADIKKPKTSRPVKAARGGHNKKADKKEAAGKIISSLERGLIENSSYAGPQIELFKEKSNKLEDAMFLPKPVKNESEILYGTASFYSFFRHFHCLYERLIKARELAENGLDSELEKKPEIQGKFKEILAKKKAELISERYEQIYLKGLYSLLRNNIDTTKYEDFCRQILGTQAYLLFSIDKLINSVFFHCLKSNRF